MASPSCPNSPPDGRRAGATWVAATGAFLLLASAAVFVAVRWDRLPDAAKVALVGALTGACLVGGRALRRTLPATGDVLFHLGALLIPVDVAAMSLRLHLGWRTLLLAEGLIGVAAMGALAVATGSVVLSAAAGASMVVLAGGIAAVSPVPAPLVLVAAAAGAHLLRRHRLAVSWAGVAGLAPVLGAVATAVLRVSDAGATGVMEELGLGGHRAALVAVASSAVAAVVLGREAARRRDLALVALAGACLASGGATTWVNADLSRDVTFLSLPALFVVIQVLAMLGQRDPFWGRPARAVALATEGVAALAAPVAAALLLLAPFVERGFDLFGDAPPWRPQPAAALGWALLAGGWLLAAWRRQPPQPSPLAALRAAAADDRTVVFLASAAGAAAVVGTASTIAIAATLVGLAAGLASSRRPLATVVAAAAVLWAPVLVASAHPLASMPIGIAGAGVLGFAAIVWRGTPGELASIGLAVAGALLAFFSCVLAGEAAGLTVAMLAAVAAAWSLALLVERACPAAGHAVRAAMVLGVLGALASGPTAVCASSCRAGQVLPVAALATLLFGLDAVRSDEPLIALGAALCIQVVVGSSALGAGVGDATVGVLLCASAVAYCALSALYPARWRLPFVAAAGAALLAGLPLAAGDGARFAEALILAGGLAVSAGLILRNGVVGHAGGAVVVAGIALDLGVDGLTTLEAFAAPVAVQLLIAGWQLRRRPPTPSADQPSSWVAYGPAIGLLGGTALVERLTGGPAWHALVAGAVGVLAVWMGGWKRLAGPVFLGTALVVAVTVLESLTTLAGVPTWAWLAAGGATLLSAGVALERSATSPVEAGRRLVDVVDERFS